MSESGHRLDRLFRPRSVAVVGASPKGGYGLTTLRNMRGVGFEGRLYAVHPRLDEVDGVPAAPTLGDLPDVPDAIAVAVPAASVPGVLTDAAALGVGGAVVYASGFGELGDRGRVLQERLEVTSAGLPVIGPNCLGLAAFRSRAALWGISLPYVHAGADGCVALAAQSGNMCLTAMMSGRLPSVAYGASLGNQVSLDVSDCLDYFLTDPQVRVIGLIIEGLPDLKRFRHLAERAARADVGVVALKVGRSARGVAAAVAHTGTLAGSDGAYDALFRQTGVIRVDDLDELIAVSALLAAPHRPAGTGLGVFASSGGECGLVADLAEQVGVAIVDPAPATRQRLAAVLPEYGQVGNPFDLTAGGWGQFDVYATASRALADDPEVDLVAFIGDSPTYSGSLEDAGWPAMVGGVGKTASEVDVPVALVTTTTDTSPELPELCRRSGVVFMAGIRPALRALQLAGDRAQRLQRTSVGRPAAEGLTADGLAANGLTPDGLGVVAPGAADRARALLGGRQGVLSESVSKQLLREYGVTVPEGDTAPDAETAAAIAARIGFPVVVKVEAEGLAHKSDIGGVILGLADPDSVRGAVATVLERGVRAVGAAAVTGVRVERGADLRDATELIVGGRNDRGSVVVLGAGGVLAELLADAATLLWPFTCADVEETLARLGVGRLLCGYRGAPPADLAAVVDVVLRVGRLLADLPEIAELDVNPLLCAGAGRGALALDALAVVRPQTPPNP